MTGAGKDESVRIRRYGAEWLAEKRTPAVRSFAVVATERKATTAARFLNQMAAALADQPDEDELVLTRGEFSAARTVLDALGGEDG